jgi:hypothetical protein
MSYRRINPPAPAPAPTPTPPGPLSFAQQQSNRQLQLNHCIAECHHNFQDSVARNNCINSCINRF